MKIQKQRQKQPADWPILLKYLLWWLNENEFEEITLKMRELVYNNVFCPLSESR